MPTTREQEMRAAQDRRIERWYRSLTPEERQPNMEVMDELYKQGYVDETNVITAKGELYMHQLRLLEWMKKHYEWDATQNKYVKKPERTNDNAKGSDQGQDQDQR